MSTLHDKIIEESAPVPQGVPTLEERFRNPDGTLDHLKLQQYLLTLQAKGEDISQEELREAITAIRLLRRTNTGPSAGKKPRAKKGTIDSLDDLI